MLFPRRVFLRCSLKRLTWVLIFLSTTLLFTIWYMTRLVNVKFMLDQFHDVKKLMRTKRILVWNGYEKLEGLDIQCPNYNCAFRVRTNDSDVEEPYLYTILFDEKVLNSLDRPLQRWEHQLYIFWSLTPPEKAPACGIRNDNFFNWTFTYRLDSTLVWNYFVVQNMFSNEIVAPDKSVIWQTSQVPLLHPDVKSSIDSKMKSLAWVKTCTSSSHPGGSYSSYMESLQLDMAKLSLHFDVFDECTPQETPDDVINEEEYFFFIAFEDYFAKDYVTDKVMRAYNNYAVPIVYGGANYSWFLPPGSYLDASNMSSLELAFAIRLAVRKPSVYASFFNWTNVYDISAYPNGGHPLCRLCSALNSRTVSNESNVNFRRWWNTPESEKSCNETQTN